MIRLFLTIVAVFTLTIPYQAFAFKSMQLPLPTCCCDKNYVDPPDYTVNDCGFPLVAGVFDSCDDLNDVAFTDQSTNWYGTLGNCQPETQN